jgi:hypothetical protein
MGNAGVGKPALAALKNKNIMNQPLVWWPAFLLKLFPRGHSSFPKFRSTVYPFVKTHKKHGK